MKVPVQKVRFVGLRKHSKVLLKDLHQRGVLHLVENEALAKANPMNDEEVTEQLFDAYDTARIDFAIRYLTPYAPAKGTMESMLNGGKLILSEEDSGRRFMEFAPQINMLVEKCEKAEETTVRHKNELVRLRRQLAEMQSFKAFPLVIDASLETKQTETYIIKMSQANKEAALRAISQETNLLDLSVLSEDEQQAVFRLTVYTSVKKKVISLLSKNKIDIVDLAAEYIEFTGKTPAQIIEVLESRIAASEKELADIQEDLKDSAKHLEELQIAYDYSVWRQTKNSAQQTMFQSKNFIVFEGWLPMREFATLSDWMKKAFLGEVTLEKIEPGKDEQPPALLENKAVVGPFQVLTEMFGSPRKDELDPTPIMAPFFILFFGICFSDVGYGFLMAVVSAFFLLKGRFDKETYSSFSMIFWMGISALIGGVIFGGWLGMTAEQAPSFLLSGNEKLPFIGQLLNPLVGSGPMTFLMLCVGLGFTQLVIGTFMGGVTKWKYGRKGDAIGENFLWVYTLLAILCWVLADTIGLSKEVMKWLVVIGFVALVIAGGRKSKNPIVGFFLGLLSLYGIMDYVSNMLSYARLMALGMATGIIGFAMNLTASVLGDLLPGILGIIIMVAFLLFGHSLNFGLSILGSYVHSMRLQYIEYFGRFYEGGAPLFKPFGRIKKYLVFERDIVKH